MTYPQPKSQLSIFPLIHPVGKKPSKIQQSRFTVINIKLTSVSSVCNIITTSLQK